MIIELTIEELRYLLQYADFGRAWQQRSVNMYPGDFDEKQRAILSTVTSLIDKLAKLL